MHKIKVGFFAALREQLGISELLLELSGSLTVGEIKEIVAVQLKDAKPLFADGIQASVDFDFARSDDIVDTNKVKEIAFFPPVTGG